MLEQMGEEAGRVASIPVIQEPTITMPRHYQIDGLIPKIEGKRECDIRSEINNGSRCRGFALKLHRSFEAVRGQDGGRVLNFTPELFARYWFVAHRRLLV